MPAPANIINHIALVLDASSSMQGRAKDLVKVADQQVAHLADRSKELDQETRITVYQFGSQGHFDQKIDCLVYDKDVLRMPSIASLYKAYGMTPLIDATWLALDDLALTPEKYGEHSFLVYVMTDGQENASKHSSYQLREKLGKLPEHWTLATFVPDQMGVRAAMQFGFPVANIAVWDATTAAGVQEAGAIIRQTTDNFMRGRAAGVRGSRNLFELKDVTLRDVKTKLVPVPSRNYEVYNVIEKCRIDDFVETETGRPYRKGTAFYQLSKRETVQPQKQVAIMGAKGVYVGQEARDLLGLPDRNVDVSPNHSPDYDIFVQSTSMNRNLMPRTKLLVFS